MAVNLLEPTETANASVLKDGMETLVRSQILAQPQTN